MAKQSRYDSNDTELSYGEELTLGVLDPLAPMIQLLPEGYNGFGGDIETVESSPLAPGRQKQKAVPVGREASGGFTHDLSFPHLYPLLQGFMFADARGTPRTAGLNGLNIVDVKIESSNELRIISKDVDESTSWINSLSAGSVIILNGFENQINNNHAIVVQDSVQENDENVVYTIFSDKQLVVEPTAGSLIKVGDVHPSGELSISVVNNVCRLKSTSIKFDVLEGSFIYLGDPDQDMAFKDNIGFARVATVISDTEIILDKISWAKNLKNEISVNDVIVYFGETIRNEESPSLIKRRTYRLERVISHADGQAEYLVGAVANELNIQMPMQSKITTEMNFVAMKTKEVYPAKEEILVAPRIKPVTEDLFNTSNDFAAIKLSIDDPTVSITKPLFTYATDITLNINNNVTPANALANFDSIDLQSGTFEVTGDMVVYFNDMEAKEAISLNKNTTIEVIIAKNNKAFVIDIPLVVLGEGELAVELDNSVMMNLSLSAAKSRFGNTLTFNRFHYTPTSAQQGSNPLGN